MRTFYFFFLAGLFIVMGMLLFPSLHLIVGGIDMTGWYPILKSAVTLLPWGFLGFIVYAIVKMRG